MAILKNGILGGFSGKISNVVGYTMGDLEIIRSIPVRTKAATQNEIDNRKAFGLVQNALSAIKPFIRVGCKGFFTKTGGMRGANSYNRQFALTGSGPDLFIDPEKFLVTGGGLPGAEDPSFLLEDFETMRFHWDAAVPEGGNALDQVMLLVMDLEGPAGSYCNIGAFRSSGTETVKFSPTFKGRLVHLYMGFVAKDRSAQSMSQYLGSINIPS